MSGALQNNIALGGAGTAPLAPPGGAVPSIGTTPAVSPASPDGTGSNVDIAGIVSKAAGSLTASINDLISSGGDGGSGPKAQADQGADLVAKGQMAANSAMADAALRLQQDNAASAAAFGTQPGSSSSVITTMAKSILAGEQDIENRRDMIQQKLNVNFLDDPIGFITNQMSVPFDQESLNNVIGKTQGQLSVLKQLMDISSQVYTNNAALDQADPAAVADAKNTIALGQALEVKADSGFKAAQLGIEGANVRIAANRAEFDAAVATSQAFTSAAHLDLEQKGLAIQTSQLAISQQHLDLAKIQTVVQQDADQRAQELHTFQIEEARANSANLEDRRAGIVAMQSRLTKALQITGLGQGSMTYAEFQQMAESPIKQAINSAMFDPSIQDGRISYDPATAVHFMNIANLPLTPGQNIVRDTLTKSITDVQSQEAMMWKSYSPDIQHLKEMTKIQSDVNSQIANISQGSMYEAPSLSETLKIPEIAKLGISQDLAPLTAVDPLYPTKANDILTAGLMRTIPDAKGVVKATPAQVAAEISTIYQAAMASNNSVRQYNRAALPRMGYGPGSTNGYRTSVQTGQGFSGTSVVDMASSSAVEGVLTRMLIGRIQQQSIATPGGGIP